MESELGGAAAIEVSGLTKSFGARRVLSGLSFRIEPGEVVAFLGPNGAGKSTTIRILTGQLPRDGGAVHVLGRDPASDSAALRREIAFLPDTPPLYDALTPREQLELVAGLHELDDATAALRIPELLGSLGLDDLADVPLAACSRGNRQRTALAAAFIVEPRLVLLDEPLSGLDAPTVLQVKEILRRLAQRGVAVLYSSHLLDVAESVASRVLILHEGEIVADGAPGALLAGRPERSLEQLFRQLTSDADVEARAERFLASARLTP
ncbi:MAG: ABC transporter ATP-binding protein [Planctomycetes bacterium]|nr:ABC transporter ATP-binding protein [Planctomycetota bacterium]